MTETVQRVTRAELLERVSKISPILRENATEAETARRLPDANIDAMTAEGLFALRSPARFGGLDSDLRTYTDVVARIASSCGSSGWIAFISNATAWVVSSVFSEQALEEVYAAGPSTRFIGLLAPTGTSRRVDGGHAVTGRWGFASNSAHADWAMLTAPLEDEHGVTSPHLIVVPMDELTVEDTWFVAGMCGTGSNTVETRGEVIVPEYRTVSFKRAISGLAQRARSHDSAALMENFVISAVHMVGAPVIGMARAALDVTLERLQKPKSIAYTFYDDTRDAPSTQINIAKAATLIDTAEILLETWADRTVDAAREVRDIDVAARARFRANFGYAMECCRDAMKLLLNVQGASAFATSNPVQRIWRDLETASRHGLLNHDFGQELYSRSLLGIEEPITALV